MSRKRRRGWWACRPGLETLEGRRLPAQFGVPWLDAKHLSISFVPDGTPIAGHQSSLFKALDAREPTAVWQREILQAFQTWAVQAHVNFSVAADGGEPFGVPGPDQHDPRFGDIRIGAQPMSPEVLSISVPHDPFLSGTWSGDVLLNSNVAFDGGGASLLAVMLHEAGHVLGIGQSDDPASVMFEHLDNSRDGLAPGDVAAVQALYGPRPDDTFEGPRWNDTLEAASPFPAPTGFDGSAPLFLYADVTTNQDADVYSLKAPAGYRGPVTVRLQTAGVSLLAPRLTVFDAAGKTVADLTSGGNVGDTLLVTLPAAEPGATYYVEARAATGGVFGVGEYALAVSFDARSAVTAAAIDTLARQSYSYLSPDDINAIFLDPKNALFHDDHHTDDTFATAAPLAAAGAYGSEAPDRITASLGDPTDVDFYRVQTPEASGGGGVGSGRPLVMTVTGRATEVNGLMPEVAVFDKDRHPVAALVLAHGDGTFTIQVAGVAPDTNYFVRVSADPTAGKSVGNYDLDVAYGHEAATPTAFVESTLGGPVAQRGATLVVRETQLFALLLAASPDPGATGSAERMTVTDAAGRVVLSRTAGVGATQGGDPVLLKPGVYQVSFDADSPGGPPPVSWAFRLYGASLTDPIGPALDDPTLNPIAGPTPVDPSVTTLPAVGSPGDPYAWLAVSLSAPGGVSGGPATVTAPGGPGPGNGRGPALGNGPTVLKVQDTLDTALPSAGRSRTSPPPGQTPATAASAPARPTQSPFSRSSAVAALTVAAVIPAPGNDAVDLPVESQGEPRLVTGSDVAPTAPAAEPTRPPVEAPSAPADPSPTPPTPVASGPRPEPLPAAQTPDVAAPRGPSPVNAKEAGTGSALLRAVAILGTFAGVYGYGRRLRVTTRAAGTPRRRAVSGKPAERKSAAPQRV